MRKSFRLFTLVMLSCLTFTTVAHAATADISVDAVICPKNTGNGKDIVTVTASFQWDPQVTNGRGYYHLYHRTSVNRDGGGTPGVSTQYLVQNTADAPGNSTSTVEFSGYGVATSYLAIFRGRTGSYSYVGNCSVKRMANGTAVETLAQDTDSKSGQSIP